jgi:regulatory protein
MASRRRRAASVDVAGPEDLAAVRAKAISLLARRDFASTELRDRLERHGASAEVAAAAVTELAAKRILDDARYAERYVSYHSRQGQGPIRISGKLQALGLASDVIEAALAAGPDWRALAREMRIRKFGSAIPADWKDRARQARFLQYRGFSSDHIGSALGAEIDPD